MQDRQDNLKTLTRATDMHKQNTHPIASAIDNEKTSLDNLPDELKLKIFADTQTELQFASLARTNHCFFNLANDVSLKPHKQALEIDDLPKKITNIFKHCRKSLKVVQDLEEATKPFAAWDPCQDDMHSAATNMAITILISPILLVAGRSAAAYQTIAGRKDRQTANKELQDICDLFMKKLYEYCEAKQITTADAVKELKLSIYLYDKVSDIHLKGTHPVIDNLPRYSAF